MWCDFGLAVAGRILTSLWDPAAIAYAVLSLAAIRMVPVAIALLGERYQPLTVAFIGWFGPCGLASIVFLVIALSGLEEAGVDPGPLPAARRTRAGGGDRADALPHLVARTDRA